MANDDPKRAAKAVAVATMDTAARERALARAVDAALGELVAHPAAADLDDEARAALRCVGRVLARLLDGGTRAVVALEMGRDGFGADRGGALPIGRVLSVLELVKHDLITRAEAMREHHNEVLWWQDAQEGDDEDGAGDGADAEPGSEKPS